MFGCGGDWKRLSSRQAVCLEEVSCRAQSLRVTARLADDNPQDRRIIQGVPLSLFRIPYRGTASSFSLAPESVCGTDVVGEADSVPLIRQLAGPSCRAFLAARWDELKPAPRPALAASTRGASAGDQRAGPDGAASAAFESSTAVALFAAVDCGNLRLGTGLKGRKHFSGSKTMQVILDPSRRSAHSLFVPLLRDM